MRVKTLVAVVLAMAGLTAASGSASAAKGPSFPTTVGYAGPFFGDPFNGVMSGRVESPKAACVPGRTVKLFGNDGKLLDTDRTSAKGAWAAIAPELVTSGEVRVTKRVLGKRGHRFTCKASSLTLD